MIRHDSGPEFPRCSSAFRSILLCLFLLNQDCPTVRRGVEESLDTHCISLRLDGVKARERRWAR